LVVIGRRTELAKDIDQRLRETHPDLLILQVVDDGLHPGPYASRTVSPEPFKMLAAVKDMLESNANTPPIH
jgi:hypothetical protein